MTNGSNRDDELEIIRQLLIATSYRTESNSGKIDRLTDKLDRLTNNVDRLEVKVDQLTENVSEMGVRMDESGVRVERLTVNAEADRAIMMGMLEEVVNLRQENQQILQYLFGQQRNGNGDQPPL